MIHLDTSALIAALTADRRAAPGLRRLIADGHRLAISTLVLYEWRRGPRTPDEISDAFWGFIAYGVVDEAHRPDDIGSALRTLSALEMGAGGAEERS